MISMEFCSDAPRSIFLAAISSEINIFVSDLLHLIFERNGINGVILVSSSFAIEKEVKYSSCIFITVAGKGTFYQPLLSISDEIIPTI